MSPLLGTKHLELVWDDVFKYSAVVKRLTSLELLAPPFLGTNHLESVWDHFCRSRAVLFIQARIAPPSFFGENYLEIVGESVGIFFFRSRTADTKLSRRLSPMIYGKYTLYILYTLCYTLLNKLWALISNSCPLE